MMMMMMMMISTPKFSMSFSPNEHVLPSEDANVLNMNCENKYFGRNTSQNHPGPLLWLSPLTAKGMQDSVINTMCFVYVCNVLPLSRQVT